MPSWVSLGGLLAFFGRSLWVYEEEVEEKEEEEEEEERSWPGIPAVGRWHPDTQGHPVAPCGTLALWQPGILTRKRGKGEGGGAGG